jgi:uncharacterized ferredoxin-like protein
MTIQETIKTIDEPKGWLKITPSDIINLNDYCKKLEIENQKQLEEILPKLEEISEGKGSYDTDHFKHAQNCIRDMKLLALEVIRYLTDEKIENCMNCGKDYQQQENEHLCGKCHTLT